MSEIATLTFHRASNHGAALQALALQVVLQDLGVTTEVLDYRSPVIEERYRAKTWRDNIKPKRLARILLKNGYSFDNRAAFTSFRDEFLAESDEHALTAEEFATLAGGYSAVVVGSDQVWNPVVAGDDYTYFLDSLSEGTARIAYAASFGVESFDERVMERIAGPLTRMDAISVRERAGVGIVRDAADREATVVLDPTMLLTADGWRATLGLEGAAEPVRPYVFLYLMHEDRELIAHARELAREIDGEVVYISQRLITPRGVRAVRGAGPREWMTLLSGAAAVVTNSFHGTALSLVFEKDLHVALLPARTGVNSRIVDVLGLAGLSGRLAGLSLEHPKVDWSIVSERLAAERGASVSWLSGVVSEALGRSVEEK